MGPFVKKRQSRQHREGGFSLIEVMVALAYLTVGLLAIAAMEDIALSRNVDARRLTVATNLAGEMIDRIRYNSPTSLTRLIGAPIPGNPWPYHGIVVTCAGMPPVCVPAPGNAVVNVSAVSGNSTAVGDLAQWTAGLASVDSNGVPLLLNAVGTVTVAPVDAADLNARKPLLVTVQVSWTAGVRTPTIAMNTIVAPL